MVDTMYDDQWGGKGFLKYGFVLLLVWPIYQPRHSNNVCVGYDFADGDIVVGSFLDFYYLDYEEFIRWSYQEDGFLMWSRRRYMLLRLFMNKFVSVGSILVCFVTTRSAYKFAMRLVGYMLRWPTILTCSSPLKIYGSAILHLPSPSDGVQEPSI